MAIALAPFFSIPLLPKRSLVNLGSPAATTRAPPSVSPFLVKSRTVNRGNRSATVATAESPWEIFYFPDEFTDPEKQLGTMRIFSWSNFESVKSLLVISLVIYESKLISVR